MNDTLIHQVKAIAERAFSTAFSEATLPPVEVTVSTQEKFGHYQCNSALKLAKTLKKSPLEIAKEVKKALDQESKFFSLVEIAPPGFINLTLNPSFLSSSLKNLLKDPFLAVPRPKQPKRVIVEFSSPNIAKEMHVGHLRSTIIGDCIARVFEFLGHNVLRINHLGDWGTAFGMLIAHMMDIAPRVLSGQEQTSLSTLMTWYKESKKRFDEDEDFKQRSRLQVVKLQGGDPDALKAWEIICAISTKAFKEVYDLLDIHLVDRGESVYNPVLPQVVQDLSQKGLVTISDGAKCVFHEGFNIPLMIQKSDGGYNYDTTDIAAMKQRIFEEEADRIIVVVDAGQSLHFQLVYLTCVKAGYLNPQLVRFDHVPFGVVLGPDGKKFRTRSGETEKLIDLLTTAIEEAKKILLQRDPDISESNLKNLSHILGIDSVKYADLSCNRVGDYIFSYERMLRFEGNTAAFILYSYVRINGIKRKVGIDSIDDLIDATSIELTHPSEIQLVVHLLQFSEMLFQVAQELLPNLITDYLFQLAQKFNAFFRDCRVEGTEEQNSRLLICEAAARILKTGLNLLGLKTVDRM